MVVVLVPVLIVFAHVLMCLLNIVVRKNSNQRTNSAIFWWCLVSRHVFGIVLDDVYIQEFDKPLCDDDPTILNNRV